MNQGACTPDSQLQLGRDHKKNIVNFYVRKVCTGSSGYFTQSMHMLVRVAAI